MCPCQFVLKPSLVVSELSLELGGGVFLGFFFFCCMVAALQKVVFTGSVHWRATFI